MNPSIWGHLMSQDGEFQCFDILTLFHERFSTLLFTDTDRTHLLGPYSGIIAALTTTFADAFMKVFLFCSFGEILHFGITGITALSPIHIFEINMMVLIFVAYLRYTMHKHIRHHLRPCRFVAGSRHPPIPCRMTSVKYQYILFAIMLCGHDFVECASVPVRTTTLSTPRATTHDDVSYNSATTFSFAFHDADQRVSFNDLQKGIIPWKDRSDTIRSHEQPILCPDFQQHNIFAVRCIGGLDDFDFPEWLIGKEEALFLMARTRAQAIILTNMSDTDIERTRIYRRHHPPTLVTMPPHPLRGYYRSIFANAPELQIPRMMRDHFLVFQVLPLPEHDYEALFEPYIIAMPADLIPGNVLALIHINPRPPLCDYHPTSDCQVMSIPRRCTRSQFLLAIGLHVHCSAHRNLQCDVKVGGIHWPSFATDWRYIFDGTYATVTYQENHDDPSNRFETAVDETQIYDSMSLMQTGPLLHFQGVLYVSFRDNGGHDLVRSYLTARYPELERRQLTAIHSWHVHFPGQIFTHASFSHPFQLRYSWTNHLLHDYAPYQDAGAVVLADIRPLPPSLTLRDNAITLISIPARAYQDGYVAYLVDCHVDRHVTRKAVVVRSETRFKDLCIALQLEHLLDNPNRFVKIYYRLPPQAHIFAQGMSISLPHGSFLTLLSYDLDTCHFDESLTIDAPEDATAFMQTPAMPCIHGSFSATTIWRHVHPLTTTILLSVWYHPWLYSEYFLQHERTINLQRNECARCRIQQLWYDQVGRRPLTLISLRTLTGPPPPRHAVAMLTVDDPQYRLCFIEYHFRQQWRFGTLLFAYPDIQVPIGLLFNRAEPQNDCTHGAWCRAEIDNTVAWYPDYIPVYEGAWIRLHEIPMPDEDAESQTTVAPHCTSTDADSVCTSSSNTESSSLLQVWRAPPFRHPMQGLPPPGNPQLETLDDVIWVDDKHQVVDIPSRNLIPTPCRAPRVPVLLQPPEDVVPVPDLQKLVDALFQPCTSAPLEWQKIHDLLDPKLSSAFCRLILDAPPTIPALHIYTDGSYSSKCEDHLAAWAFVVLVEFNGETYLVDYGYGLVESDELASGWTGAVESGPREAEMEGILRAVEWIFRTAYARPVVFFYDALAAGHVADGQWQARQHDKQASLLRSMTLALHTYAGTDFSIDWRHIPAHQGHLGNEIADAIAKYTFRQQSDSGISKHIDYLPYLFGQRPPIQWLWYYFRSFDVHDDFPEHAVASIPPAPPKQPLALDKTVPQKVIQRTSHPMSTSVRTAKFRFMSFNAGTLNEADGKAKRYIVPIYLREQLIAHNADILFLQETRAHTSCMLESSTHTRIISAAEAGQGGIEIWCQRFVGKHHRPTFHSRDLVVLYSSPELLFLKITYTGLRLLLISAHAPHTGRPHSQHEHFWQQLTQFTRDFSTATHAIVLGIDANTHFDCEHPPHVGPHGLELKASSSADLFLQYLTEFELFLPSTFGHFHTGPTYTWYGHSGGHQARCDYLAIPLAWNSVDLWSTTISTLDVGAKTLDHLPVTLDATLTFEKSLGCGRRPAYDRTSFQNTALEDLRGIFQAMPHVAWDATVDEHATILSNHLDKTLSQAFPLTTTAPRKSYITDETWKLRGDRIWYIRRLRATKERASLLTLGHAFDVLRYGLTLSAEFLLAPAFELFTACVYYGQRLKNLAGQLHPALRKDRTQYVITVAEQAATQSGKHLHHQLRQLGVRGKNKQRGIRPLPALYSSNGQVLQEPKTVAERWQQFFEEQEDGYRVTLDQLVDEHFQSASCDPVLPTWDELPTLQELEYQFRNTQSNRAYFEDGIPGDLLHRLPDLLARLYHPLFIKISMLQSEPLIFKGGVLTPAYKGRGSPLECMSYRSLLVSSPIGKALHAILRREAVHHFYKLAQPFQIGGLPGKSITQATHSLLAYQWAAKSRGLSVGFLFIDITNAFYRLLRQHLTSVPDGRGLSNLFHELGLHPDAFAEFQQTGAFDACDMPRHLRNMLTETLHGTWFTVAGSTSFSRTRRGTRPGDSLADLCYTYALAKILDAAFAKLDMPDQTIFYWNGKCMPTNDGTTSQPIPMLCPIWADDIALAIAHPDPSCLVANLQHVAKHVFESLAAAGMAPNFKAGKTEAVLDLRGKGAHNQLRVLLRDGMVLDLHSNILTNPLRVVDKYKHLGTWLTTGAKLVYELRSKFAIAHATLTKYRVAIFGNPALPLLKKIQLFRSLILSAITFSIGAWHTLRPVEYRQYIAGFYRLYKRLGRLHFGIAVFHWSHARLCYELGLEPPETHLAIGRLRYVQQIMREGQLQLWGLLQQTNLWWTTIFAHYDWLSRRVPYLACPDPRAEWESFYDFLSRPGNAWKNILKRAQFFELRYQSLRYEWNAWHEAALLRLQEVAPHPDVTRILTDTTDFCLKCRQTFSGPAAWSVHAFRKHGRVTPARRYAQGTQCSRCLKDYSSYTALVNHLRNSQLCLDYLRTVGTPVQPQSGWNSREELDDRRPLHMPYLQAAGPLPMPVPTVEPHFCDDTRCLHSLWTDAWQQTSEQPSSQRLEALRVATCTTTLPRDDILTALDGWIGGVLPEDWCTLDIFEVAHRFQTSCTFSWFYPDDKPVTQKAPACSVDELLKLYLRDFSTDSPLRTLAICYRPVCIAHLFSGHRRPQDIQSFAETWGGALTGATVLSVDIIFDLRTADLADPKKLDLFIRAIRAGLLHAFIAGPPCESWSVARESQDDGPRPLRDSTQLSGKEALTNRELKQVIIGNALLGATLRLFLEALLSCTFALIEHPAEPTHKPWAPSIWKLPLIQLYMRFPNCVNVHLFQGLFGAPSAKPTQFLIANGIDGADDYLHQFQTSVVLPATTSIGRTANGEWRTMRLKTCPPALCKAIVGLTEVSLAKQKWQHATQSPDWFHAEIVSLCRQFNYDVGIGPDFAG